METENTEAATQVKVCPIVSSGMDVVQCVKNKCEWWNEEELRCVINSIDEGISILGSSSDLDLIIGACNRIADAIGQS